MIELTFPWAPSVNRYWRSAAIKRFVKVYISDEGKKFRAAVKRIVDESGMQMQSGALSLRIIMYCPDWRQRDIDNLNKALLDALVHAGAIQGDEFICAAIMEKRKSADKEGRIVVQIKHVDGAVVKDSGAWLK